MSTPLRSVQLLGPEAGTLSLWSADLALGAPNGAQGQQPVVRNHALRVLTQDAAASDARIAAGSRQPQASIKFHQPTLLEAGAEVVAASILGARFVPQPQRGRADPYASLLATPVGTWPDGGVPGGRNPPDFAPFDEVVNHVHQLIFEIGVPPLRATRARLDLGLQRPAAATELTRLLGMNWLTGQDPTVFGPDMRVRRVGAGDVISLVLTPEGVEFDASVPNPFEGFQNQVGQSIGLLAIRFRLVIVPGSMPVALRLDLIGGEAAALATLAGGLRFMGTTLRDRGVLILQADANRPIPQLSWPLSLDNGSYRWGNANEHQPVLVREEGLRVRLVTAPEPTRRDISVAELPRHRAIITRSQTIPATIRLSIGWSESTGGTGPTVSAEWPRDPGAPATITADGSPGILATRDLSDRLSTVWRQSGAIAQSAALPFAFLALSRGWLQVPMPTEDDIDAGLPASAFKGLVRLGLPSNDASVVVLGAASVTLSAVWTVGAQQPLLQAVIASAQGYYDGLVWAGEASPTSLDILPTLDAGSAALLSVPITFGQPQVLGWPVVIGGLTSGNLSGLDLAAPEGDGTPPTVAWLADSALSLATTMGMTRTMDGAGPSASRDLAAYAVCRATFTFPPLDLLPSLRVTPTQHGDFSWPWEAEAGSPDPRPGISLASMTLPGIEFTAANSDVPGPEGKLVALRADLPMMDELHAAAEPPREGGENSPPPTPNAPTALDLPALSAAWTDKARSRARARTQGDRLTWRGASSWHDPADRTPCEIRLLDQPAIWTADFTVRPEEGQEVHLGSYTLGDVVLASGAALSGLSGNFSLTGGRLAKGLGDINVEVKGFAASSFVEGDRLRDNRGLAIALSPDRQVGRLSQRRVRRTRATSDDSFVLATLGDVVKLRLGGSTLLAFTFRDLPLRPDGPDSWSFTADAQNLERADGPDGTALDPDRAGNTLYEWRLFQLDGTGTTGRFDVDIGGPLRMRPLRLLAMSCSSGSIRAVSIMASVGSTATPVLDGGVFGAEDQYATGNLIRLDFAPHGDGTLTLAAITRVDMHGASAPPDEQAVRLASDGVADGQDSTHRVAPIILDLVLGVDASGPTVTSATLVGTLFGQPSRLSSAEATLSADALRVRFVAPAVPEGALALDAITIDWSSALNARPSLAFSGRLELPLRDGAAGQVPFAFVCAWAPAATATWLGISLGPVQPEVDHGRGTINVRLDYNDLHTPLGELFRGFELPAGEVLGVFAVVFAPVPGRPAAWPQPKVGSAWFECAYDPAVKTERLRAVRHRHALAGPKEARTWHSRLLIDAVFEVGVRSEIGWPVGPLVLRQYGADIPLERPFLADRDKVSDWTVTLMTTGADQMTLAHSAMPRLSGHELPTDLLGLDNGVVVLASPWRFRCIVDHSLAPAAGAAWPGGIGAAMPLTWTSLDETVILDPSHATAEGYGFLARYRTGNPDIGMRLAGLAPVDAAATDVPLSAVPSVATGGTRRPLVVSGASVIEVRLSDSGAISFVARWLLPWDKRFASVPGRCWIPQIGAAANSFPLSAYDASVGSQAPLDSLPVVPFAAQDGTQGLIENSLRHALQDSTQPEWSAPVSQSLSEGLWPPQANQPIYVRALLALKAISTAAATRWTFADAFRQDITLRVAHRRNNGFVVAPRLRIDGRVEPPAADPTQSPELTLLVLSPKKCLAQRMPPDLVASLVDSSTKRIDPTGAALGAALARAMALDPAPSVVLLALADSTYLAFAATTRIALGFGPATAGSDGTNLPPQVDWFVPPLAEQERASAPAALRPVSDTAFASAALGWPAGTATLSGTLMQAEARLGPEEARQNTDLAWAGRARSLAWPAKAWSAVETANGTVAFLAMGQRVAFDRVNGGLKAPPDRASVLVPPRARLPTHAAIEAALADINPVGTGQDGNSPRYTALLPGPLEVTVTGLRPGVFVTQHEGIVMPDSSNRDAAFDPEDPGFGRPGFRGPLVIRQVRAPRGGPLPKGPQDLSNYRRTYVADDDTTGDELTPFRLFAGSATCLRTYKMNGNVIKSAGITLALAAPEAGRIDAAWRGSITLIASLSDPTVGPVQQLWGSGLLPSKDAPSSLIRAELRVDDASVTFTTLAWSEAGSAARLLLTLGFAPDLAGIAIATVRSALANATADSRVSLAIRGEPPRQGGEPPRTQGTAQLAPADGVLDEGPPVSLTFGLTFVPIGRLILPLLRYTVVFADPSYDREAGSVTAAGTVPPSTYPDATRTARPAYRVALDRDAYDLSSTVYFRYWADPGINRYSKGRLNVALIRTGGELRQLWIGRLGTDPGAYQRSEVEVTCGAPPYALPLATLRENDGSPAQIKAGDRLRLTILVNPPPPPPSSPEAAILVSCDVGIVGTPVFPPSSAVYALVTRRGAALRTELFATAPRPETVEFPDLSADLAEGFVRRRALFLWSFTTPQAVDGASLIKFDRYGGGQLPDGVGDFLPVEPIPSVGGL